MNLEEIKAANKALKEEISFYKREFYKREQKELNDRLPMDAQDSYSSGYSDAVVHVDQQIDGLNLALKLIAKVERLTEENEQNANYAEIYQDICDKYGKNFRALLDKAKALQEENATLKQAYELACECLASNIPLCQNGALFYGWRDKKEFIDRFMQQAQQQTHETHGNDLTHDLTHETHGNESDMRQTQGGKDDSHE